MAVSKFFDNIEEYFCVWTMAIMTVIVFIQVVMRYVFSNSLSWSEELARFIFLWLSWIGASYAVKERSHFRVEMFANMIKGKSRIYFDSMVRIQLLSRMAGNYAPDIPAGNRAGISCDADTDDMAICLCSYWMCSDVHPSHRRTL
jgi:hypothetical protein